MRQQSFMRIIAKDAVTRTQVARLSVAHDWLVFDFQVKEGQYDEEIFEVDEHGTFLHFISNILISKNYFFLQGPEDRVTHTATIITSVLDVYSREEILQRAAHPPDPKDVYVIALATTTTFDPEWYQAFLTAFHHPDPDVRFYAVTSTAYTVGWDALQDPLEQVRDRDPDSEVRRIAGKTLEVLVRHDWNRNVIDAINRIHPPGEPPDSA
jgi:hypothetical protein